MRRKRGGEACELARRKRNEWSDGGIGARDDVGLGEPNDGVVENERRERFGFAPFRRASRDARPYQTGCRDAIAKSVVGVFDGGLVVGGKVCPRRFTQRFMKCGEAALSPSAVRDQRVPSGRMP